MTNKDIVCANKSLEDLSLVAKNSQVLKNAELLIFSKEKMMQLNQSLIKAQDCFNLADYQCTVNSAQQILDASPDNITALKLLEQSTKALDEQGEKKIEQNIRYNTSIDKAKKCYQKQQFECAIKQADIALLVRTEDVKAKDIKEDAQEAKKQYQLNLKRANKILKDGQACFKAVNYSCAIAKSESALEFMPSLKAAKQLKRDAKYAMENIKKAIKIN